MKNEAMQINKISTNLNQLNQAVLKEKYTSDVNISFFNENDDVYQPYVDNQSSHNSYTIPNVVDKFYPSVVFLKNKV